MIKSNQAIPVQEKLLFTGSFDLLHFGHRYALKQVAAQYGLENFDVFVAMDEHCKRKGNLRPFIPRWRRIEQVTQLGFNVVEENRFSSRKAAARHYRGTLIMGDFSFHWTLPNPIKLPFTRIEGYSTSTIERKFVGLGQSARSPKSGCILMQEGKILFAESTPHDAQNCSHAVQIGLQQTSLTDGPATALLTHAPCADCCAKVMQTTVSDIVYLTSLAPNPLKQMGHINLFQAGRTGV